MAAIKDGGIKMSLQGKKVLVVGTGKSGIAATELLCANGIDTVLFDGNKELDSKTLYEKAPKLKDCLLYTSPSPRDLSTSRMPSSA